MAREGDTRTRAEPLQIIRCLTTSIAMRMERGFYFEQIAWPFVQDYLETLSMAAASVRTLVPGGCSMDLPRRAVPLPLLSA